MPWSSVAHGAVRCYPCERGYVSVAGMSPREWRHRSSACGHPKQLKGFPCTGTDTVDKARPCRSALNPSTSRVRQLRWHLLDAPGLLHPLLRDPRLFAFARTCDVNILHTEWQYRSSRSHPSRLKLCFCLRHPVGITLDRYYEERARAGWA